MRVALGSDEAHDTVDAIAGWLVDHGHEVVVSVVGVPWPRVGHEVGVAVASGEAESGVVCCWTGTGVSMAANKVPGVRAALCTDAATATGARRWNDANVVALSLRLCTPPLAAEIVGAFLAGAPDPGEADLINEVEAPGGSAPGTARG